MLDDSERKIIEVYYYQGLNTADSAQLLHMKTTTLHNHKIKILRKLKKSSKIWNKFPIFSLDSEEVKII